MRAGQSGCMRMPLYTMRSSLMGRSLASASGFACHNLLPFRTVNIRRRAAQDVGRAAECFRERWMGMDGEREVLRGGGHFDGERAFGDQLVGHAADHADAEDDFGLGIDDELGE